jgi:hypothetical protein
MVSGDVEDNLTSTAKGQLGWATGSYFIERSVALFKSLKSFSGNVSDLGDFIQGVSAALDQSQGSTSLLGGPLEGLHDLIKLLRRN